MSGYTWNASTGTCDISCDPAFDLDCIPSSYTHILGGEGSACGGKYQRCKCESGYDWNATYEECDKHCDSAYYLACTPTSSNHITGGSGPGCSGKYIACECERGYEWNSFTDSCETEGCGPEYKYYCEAIDFDGGEGKACDGKYKSCKCLSGGYWDASKGYCVYKEVCGSEYKYTCNDVEDNGGYGEACDGKYKSCRCLPVGYWNEDIGSCTLQEGSSSSSSSSGGGESFSCSSVNVPIHFNTSGVIFESGDIRFPSSGTWYMSGVCGQSIDYVYTTEPGKTVTVSISSNKGIIESKSFGKSETTKNYLDPGYRVVNSGGLSFHCNLSGENNIWPDCLGGSFTVTATAN